MDRLKAWFSACVAKAVESLPYAGRYRYSVVSCDFDAQTLDLYPLDKGQPPLSKVPMRTPGLKLDIAQGTEVLVGYAGMRPTGAEVTSFGNDPASVLKVEILGQNTPAAFQGMAVQVTIPSSTVLVASPSPPGYAPNPAPITLNGEITGGSSVIFGG
jgi:hypothetical protein